MQTIWEKRSGTVSGYGKEEYLWTEPIDKTKVKMSKIFVNYHLAGVAIVP